MPRYGWEFGPRYGYDFGYRPQAEARMGGYARGYDQGWGMTGLFNRVMGGPPPEDRDYDRPIRRAPRREMQGWDEFSSMRRGRGYDARYGMGYGYGRGPVRGWRYDAGW